MSRRTTDCYKSVFDYINKEILPMKGSKIITDFEIALRNALREILVDLILLGCWFHYCQALRKRIASEYQLFLLIRTNEEARLLYRKCQCLALLPADKIRPAFYQLAFKAVQDFPQFLKFIEYFDKQWIRKEKPESFSVFLQVREIFSSPIFFVPYISIYTYQIRFHRTHVQMHLLRHSTENVVVVSSNMEVCTIFYQAFKERKW